MSTPNVSPGGLLARVRTLESQNRVWKLSGLVVGLLVFALSLAVGVKAQQNAGSDFVLRDASGNKIGEWVVKDGNVGLSTQVLPIPPALGPVPTPNGQSPVPINAQLALRDAAGKQTGEWVVKTGAILECHDANGKLIWSMPMKVFEQPLK